MKQLLVVCALSQELNIVKKEIKKYNISGLKIDYLQTGMGNYNTIFSLTKKLETKNYDFILNIGVCGYHNIKNIKKFYQISSISNIFTQKELIVPTYFKFGDLKNCISSELVVNKITEGKIDEKDMVLYIKNKKVKISGEIIDNFVVDMESYGFEFVLEKYNIPRLILKVPVDKVGEQTDNFDYKIALDLLKKNINYENLLLEIKKYLEGEKNKDVNYKKYFDILYFSENQKQQFNFLYRKYKFVIGDDFDSYFFNFVKENENKTNKKQIGTQFIKKLTNLLNQDI